MRLVLRNGLSLALVGVLIGVALAAWAAQLLRGLLYDIRPGDPGTFIAVVLMLSAVAVLASFVPPGAPHEWIRCCSEGRVITPLGFS